ncbi:hypothetical protein CCR75_005508 [Bremia lactucae]|uniref:Uncharacterized protein n=1 Tax=Bremia lactucae TaxID=4779 RepID=A0A976NYR2_BRELC|nr:hypothetical protein CCR75_005508 [Bremia lactucae]
MLTGHYNLRGSAMLLMAANFLQRDANKVIETGDQLILTISECVEMIATAKRADPINLTLILWYTDRHYSAYVHCTLPGPHDSGVLADDGLAEG